MLRSRSGYTNFKVVDKKTGIQIPYDVRSKVTEKQFKTVSDKPDAIWQFAQRIKQEFAEKGIDVSIYVDSHVSINGRPSKQFIDPTVDLGTAEWNYFFHNDWILLYDNQGNRIEKQEISK